MKKFLFIGVMGLILATTAVAKGQQAMVENGKTVKFDYTLTVDGKVVDSSVGKPPIEYVQGQGQIVKGLESQMLGMKVGEEKTVVVAAKDGYGEVLAEAVQPFPKTFFPADFEIKVGMIVPLQNQQGQTFPATVKEIQEDKILLDLNHPMAGKELTFAVKVVEIK